MSRLYLKASSQELVLHLQEVAFVRLRLERLVDDGELGIVLDVLPPGVAVTGTKVKGHERATKGRCAAAVDTFNRVKRKKLK